MHNSTSIIPMTEESNKSSLHSLSDDLSSIDEETPTNQKNKPSPMIRKLSDLYDNRKISEGEISEENGILFMIILKRLNDNTCER